MGNKARERWLDRRSKAVEGLARLLQERGIGHELGWTQSPSRRWSGWAEALRVGNVRVIAVEVHGRARSWWRFCAIDDGVMLGSSENLPDAADRIERYVGPWRSWGVGN